MFSWFFSIEMLDSVELGETAHKKTGTTVPESIHSFSKFHCCFYTDTEIVLRLENFTMVQGQLHEMGQIQFIVSINEEYNNLCYQLKKKKKSDRKYTGIWVSLLSKWYLWCLGRADVTAVQMLLLFRWSSNSLSYFCLLVGDGLVKPEALNKKAIQIINRVRDKLTGEQVLMFI